jgi:hypothetical protein
MERFQHWRLRFAARIQGYFPRAARRSDPQFWQRREPSSVFELLEEEVALVIF